ncbi:cytochrome c oxidase assembly factor CtaG [Planococcus lenghuensis]|uniref:Cytochrome c oxidase assembly factor CtaG n=1 Tax=Planococcus lenghuensis TaxID=2213202 RepID=A0A1Q2L077_9BACL|nr:cytochrome c oxidase assembly factor CtaG [Planococcus lenghuensis]AQQ53823.1 cytochrome c oxidase assembly factor CtaG [Planococcus lenghuensis]
MPLSIFGFQALWSPVFIGVLVFLTVLYFLITVKWRHDFAVSQPLKKKEAIAFVSGMVLLYVLKGSPIDLLSHILFSVHMTQMAFFLFLVPPLLIVGIPAWVWQSFIGLPVVRSIFAVMTRPAIALVLFGILFSFYHLPVIFDIIKQDEVYHGLYTLVLFLSAFFMWWPIMNTLPDTHKVHGLIRVGYIVGSGAMLTPACALIIFSNSAFYATYSDPEAWLQAMALCVPVSTLAGLNLTGPELFTSMSPLEDQQVGGIAMKVLQELILTYFLGMVFYQWFRREQDNADEITAQALRDRKTMLAYQRGQ